MVKPIFVKSAVDCIGNALKIKPSNQGILTERPAVLMN
jgi:hypothetical protein